MANVYASASHHEKNYLITSPHWQSPHGSVACGAIGISLCLCCFARSPTNNWRACWPGRWFTGLGYLGMLCRMIYLLIQRIAYIWSAIRCINRRFAWWSRCC